ncbi:MAG: hypothetical protein LVS60_12855 [Nodosilinea sp. LVE1205-7]
MALSSPPTSSPTFDPVVRASCYLAQVRQRSPDPTWIKMAHPDHQYLAVLTWIGNHIDSLNQNFHGILADLISCWPPHQRLPLEILVAPLNADLGIDGFCSFQPQSTTLVVDPGRIIAVNWPQLVGHELAHAMARSPGHGECFHAALAHLCLAQGWPLPPDRCDRLKSWPPCQPHPQPQQFWLGN